MAVKQYKNLSDIFSPCLIWKEHAPILKNGKLLYFVYSKSAPGYLLSLMLYSVFQHLVSVLYVALYCIVLDQKLFFEQIE